MESNSLLKTTVKKSSISTLKRYSHLHIFMIFSVITVLTDHITNVYAQNQVDTSPHETVKIEGQSVSLLCRSGLPLNYCRIKIPGEVVLNLSPDWNAPPGFTYYSDGGGLEAGQCGVTIQRVSARNHGQVECYLGTRGVEATGKINLIVALAPNRPEIEVLTPARGNAYEVDQQFRARCVVRDGRPAANIAWFLNDEPIYEGLGKLEEISSLDSRNTTLITTVQEIQRVLTAKDNGKSLICRATHITDTERPKESGLQLFVRYRPQPLPDIKVYGLQLGSTAIINVTIESNPRPRIDWTVDGIVIPQGTQNGRYEAYEPIDLGDGLYNVTLSLAGLTLEDTNKDYYLKASNEFGSQDYTIKISSSNTPASSGLDVGAIVGIVVAVVIILIAVLLIIFARATGRWCFAAKPSKTTTSETLDDVQVGVNSALLRNPDNSNVYINSNPANSKRKSRNNSNGDASTRKGSDHILSNRNDSVYNPTTVPINNSSQSNKGNQKKSNYSSIQTQPQQQHQQQQPSSDIAPLSSSSDINAGNSLKPFQDGYGSGDGINKSNSNNNNNNNNNNKSNNKNSSSNSSNDNKIQNATTTATATTKGDSSENVRDLLTHGNELGIPESRCSKWIPKDQRELLEKQAKLLVNRDREGKSTVIY